MRLIKAKEAAELLNVRLSRLYELTRQNAIPVVRVGEKQLRYDTDALAHWANRGGTVSNDEGNHNNEQTLPP